MTVSQRTIILTLTLPQLLIAACAPNCKNNVLQTLDNPQGTKVAVLYTRECGATTGPSTNVSILTRDAIPPERIGNVLVLKDPASAAETSRTTRLRWSAADTLEVSLLGGRAVQSKADALDGVSVHFTSHSDREP